MTKRVMISILLAATLALSGCSAANHSSGKTDLTTQVLTNTTKRAAKIETMEMTMNMGINVAANGVTNNQTVKTDSKIFRNQPLLYQDSQIKNGGKTTELIQYMDNHELYFQSSANHQWTKADLSGSEGDLLKSSFKKQSNPNTQLALMKSVKKHIKLKKVGTDYVIQFSGKKKDLQQFMQKAMMANVTAAQKTALENSLALMEFTSMDYTYVIDSKTYDPKTLSIAFTAKSKNKATPFTLKMSIESVFSHINQLKKMTIPASIKKKALAVTPAQLQAQQ